MADLNKIQAAQAQFLCDGVSQEVELKSTIPAGTEVGLVVRDACLGQQTMANSRPVVIASNQSALTVVGNKTNDNAAAGTNNAGVLPAVCTTAAPTYTTGNQVALSTDTSGNLRTVLGTGTNASQVQGNVASGAADSGNPVKIGAVGRTTNPTAVTNGQRVDVIADKIGRLVVTNMQVRDLKTNARTSISNTTETTILSAGGAGVFHDITQIIITNTSTNKDANVDFRDSTAGTIQVSLRANAQDTIVVNFADMLKQGTANNNWTAQSDSATATLSITVLAIKNI